MGSGLGVQGLGSGLGVQALGSGLGVQAQGSGLSLQALGSGLGVQTLGSWPRRRRAECVPDLGGQRAVLARGVGEADDELAQDDDGEQAEALGQV